MTTFTNDFSREIYEQTYRMGDETIDMTQKRVADFLASIEEDTEKHATDFLWALQEFKFVPGGRITSNAGLNLQGTTLINCFVSAPEGEDVDSMAGIHRELGNQMMILKCEGGYGFCASFMRPRGAFIAGIANFSPGSVEMLNIWEASSATITAGSGKKYRHTGAKGKIRKGAQMVTMHCWHPDVCEVGTAKQQPERLTKFIMSVLITDDFMDAVKNNKSWNLEYPDYEYNSKIKAIYKKTWDGNLAQWKAAGYPVKIYHSYENADELYTIIMESTYKRNEPGVLFIDTINRMNNLYYCETIQATNPCVTADTWIMTSTGSQQVKDLLEEPFKVVVAGREYDSTPFWHTGVRTVYKINTNQGHEVTATKNHRFKALDSRGWVSVGELKENDILCLAVKQNFTTIKSINQLPDPQPVYDCTVKDIHAYDANGFLSHNCGEQALPPGGVCLLGSINLTQFIAENGGWDYEKLGKLIPIIVRMLDNVNDLTLVPLETQKWNIQNKRRLGLGVLGYASALMMMKVRYGSDEALKMTEELMKFIRNNAYKASCMLAKEKEAFPLFDAEKYLAGEFVKTLDANIRKLIAKHGMRNSHLLSIQPTGNSSVYANNVSGGLEPIWQPISVRTSNMPRPPTGMHLPINIDWTSRKATMRGTIWKWKKEGDENLLYTSFNDHTWKMDRSRGLLRETDVVDYAVHMLRERGEWNPNAKWVATVPTLSIAEHVKTMQVFSRFIDSSMSKTVNLPADYTFNAFKKLYINAYDTGTIKGVTTYREGTMAYVLSSIEKPAEIIPTRAPMRPKKLPCDIHVINFKRVRHIVLVGMMNGKPFEVFSFREGNVRFTNKLKSGTLVKTGSGKYTLETDAIILEDLNQNFERCEESLITRLISLLLKNGVNINDIYDQLQKSGDSIASFSRVIARTLSCYVTAIKNTHCGACDSPEGLVFQEGCITCKDCGWSKCS